MFKKVIVILAAAMLSFSTFASDTIKGTNVQGKSEVVALAPIYAAKLSNGVLTYRVNTNWTTEYTLTGPDMNTQYAKVLAYFGSANTAYEGQSGMYWNLNKIKVICQSTYSQVVLYGSSNPIDLTGDGCQFWQTANSQ